MSLEPPVPPPPPDPSAAAPPPPLPPPQTRRFRVPELADALRSGWGSAAIAAALVLAVVIAFNVLLAVLNNAVAPDTFELDGQVISEEDVLGSPLSAGDALQFGLISTYTWHGVGLRMEVEVPFQEGGPPVPVVASFAFAQVLGLLVVGYLLFRAGGAVADRARGEGWVRAIHGPKLALLYALLAAVVSLLVGFRFEFPTPPGSPPVEGLPEGIAFKPSLVGAFFMPLALALVIGTLGAIGRGVIWSARGLWRLGFAAIAGAWRMTWMTVLFASVGFLIVAAFHPDETRAYFEFVGQGEVDATIVATIQTLILLPNVGVGVGAASMGGSINLAFFGGACPMISYASFPDGVRLAEPDPSAVFGGGCGLLPIDFDLAPPVYLLFLLVPLVATIVGGVLAAQRAGGLSRGRAAVVGLAAALPFAVFVWLLAVFARFGGSASGVPSPVPLSFWVGPGLVSTFLLALVWGTAGGALGGALAANARGPGQRPGPQQDFSS